MRRIFPCVLILLLLPATVFFGCSESDENSDMDGDQSTDGDVADGDAASDGDTVPDGDIAPDGDEVVADGDTEVDEEDPGLCSGECNPETYPQVCIDEMNLCACDEAGALEALNCNDICLEADYCGATECGDNPDTGVDTCWCYTCECASDQDCVVKGMDYCVSLGESTVCASRCDLELCSDTVGCLNVGDGEGCGICFEQGKPACATSGEDCSAGEDGSRYCSNLCDLSTAACYDTCEAAPNSCATGELCFPLAGDTQGNIVDGVCIDYGASCPACGDVDGDVDSDIDNDADSDADDDADGDIEVESTEDEL